MQIKLAPVKRQTKASVKTQAVKTPVVKQETTEDYFKGYTSFRKKLADLISLNGWIQEEVAEALGIRQSVVSHLIRPVSKVRLQPSVAVRLELLTGIPAKAWLEKQFEEELPIMVEDAKKQEPNTYFLIRAASQAKRIKGWREKGMSINKLAEKFGLPKTVIITTLAS
jgi:plasmid maintenance system antidote protein VapI